MIEVLRPGEEPRLFDTFDSLEAGEVVGWAMQTVRLRDGEGFRAGILLVGEGCAIRRDAVNLGATDRAKRGGCPIVVVGPAVFVPERHVALWCAATREAGVILVADDDEGSQGRAEHEGADLLRAELAQATHITDELARALALSKADGEQAHAQLVDTQLKLQASRHAQQWAVTRLEDVRSDLKVALAILAEAAVYVRAHAATMQNDGDYAEAVRLLEEIGAAVDRGVR